ncbi:MAG: hypothetical protein VX089_04790, partial [Pseudomonadota bacterium]|nr:hypothetical protein [Pseudomonadota bacterium]
GLNIQNEKYNFSIKNKKSKKNAISRKFSFSKHGYLEIYVNADNPIFKRVIPEPGYAILKIKDSSIVINPDIKFGRSRLIAQTRNLRSFCMIHSAIINDKENNIQNSFLLINPYEKKIKVKISSQTGKSLKKILMPHTVSFENVSDLIDKKKNLLGSVMLSAPNRIVVYDIKHQYQNLKNIYSIDHLDPYSGRTTYHDFSVNAFLKNYTRKIFSYLNIRYD